MAYTEFTCRSGGSNMNAGTLDGSAEAATAPLVTYTNGGWNSGTGVFTPASGDPTADGVAVGQFAAVFNDGATTPVFVGRITARDATTITVSTTAKSGTAPTTNANGRTLVVGGAWAGPSGASPFPFNFVTNTLTDASSNPLRVNFKNDQTYSITAGLGATNQGPITYQGYGSTFGDSGRATVDGGTSGASYALMGPAHHFQYFANFILQNNGATGVAEGFLQNVGLEGCVVTNVVVHDVRGNGFMTNGRVTLVQCEAYNCNQSNTAFTAGFSCAGSAIYDRCISHDNTTSNTYGFYGNTALVTLVDCIADNNGSHGFHALNSSTWAMNGCTAYDNGGSGFAVTTAGNVCAYLENCLLVSNTRYGVEMASGTDLTWVKSCAFYDNTLGQTNGVSANHVSNSVTLSGDPFTAPTTGNFTLNNTAGAGAACREAGAGTFTQTQASYTGTVSYPDIGAAQVQGGSQPAVGDVRSGVVYGGGTGTLALPAVGDVQSGVQFGAGGTEYTGTFTVPTESNVVEGIQYGAGGTEYTGTFEAPSDATIAAAVWAYADRTLTG